MRIIIDDKNWTAYCATVRKYRRDGWTWMGIGRDRVTSFAKIDKENN